MDRLVEVESHQTAQHYNLTKRCGNREKSTSVRCQLSIEKLFHCYLLLLLVVVVERMLTATEQIMDIRQTLRYLGAPITTKSFLFGDNRSVVTSATLPHSTLTKRHNILAFHRDREAIAAKTHGFLLGPVCLQLK